MEHRIDFIRRLFVVAITVGFASRIVDMQWFSIHRWPTRSEWHAIVLLIVGLVAVIESWEGYFSVIAERPQKTITRFVIDIMVAFAFLFLLLSSTYLPFFVSILAIIFMLYVFWNASLFLEYGEEYVASSGTSVPGRNRALSLLKQYVRGMYDPLSSTYSIGITSYWALYFLLICLTTLLVKKEMTFAVALFTVYGLSLYGIDKRKHFSIMTRLVFILGGWLLFSIMYFVS